MVGGGSSYADDLANNVILNDPWSIALTPSGELLVGEVGTGVVRKVYSDGMVKTIAGGGSVVDGDEIPAKQARIKPWFVGQTHHDVLIADQGGRIKQLYPACYGVAGYDSPAIMSRNKSTPGIFIVCSIYVSLTTVQSFITLMFGLTGDDYCQSQFESELFIT